MSDQHTTPPTPSPHPAVPSGGLEGVPPVMAAQAGREANPELNLMTLAPSATGNETVYRFKFTGSAGEYFRIWIVNTLLTILTLGLWSPWAKIRKKKWFLGHTWVAGANFDYHASAWPIFRGRVLAAIAFFLYWIAGEFQPKYAAWVALALAIVAPILIVGSLRFNLVNTSYRNVRFSSQSTLMLALAAIAPFILGAALAVAFPLVTNAGPEESPFRSVGWTAALSPLVFTIFYPYVHGKVRLLALNHSKFGSALIRCTTRVKTFYSAHIRGSVIGMGMMLAAGVVTFAAGMMLAALGASMMNLFTRYIGREAMVVIAVITTLPFAFAFLIWYAATQTRLINSTFNLTRVGENVRVFSEIRTLPMAKLYLINTIAILFTLGLALPWAAVRTARQRVETTALAITGDLDRVVAENIKGYDATADAATDFFSLDISL